MTHQLKYNIHIWSNDPNSNNFKVFLSTLSLMGNKPICSDSYRDANLWCLIGNKHAETISNVYSKLVNIPEIIILGDVDKHFSELQHNTINIPIKFQAVEKWFNTQLLNKIEVVSGSKETDTVAISDGYDWISQLFKLKKLPNNIDIYQNSETASLNDIQQLCKFMYKNWVSFDDLLTSNVDEYTICSILIDAEQKNNITYKQDHLSTSQKIITKVNKLLSN